LAGIGISANGVRHRVPDWLMRSIPARIVDRMIAARLGLSQ
jgi:hypothetical protein